MSVRMNTGFLDWNTQPCAFKTYPHFYTRLKLDKTQELDRLVALSAGITYEKKYGKDSYFLRVQPSAGALYPTELYVQTRGVAGKIDGIYHYEPHTDSLTLLHELNGDGLEGVAGLDFCIKGTLFLISSPYFRSSWKYKNRALRYCLLDSGHQYGALYFAAASLGVDMHAVFDFDKPSVADFMGFENKEFAMLLAFSGERIDKSVKLPLEKLPFVSPTDYFEPNETIEKAYEYTLPKSYAASSMQNTHGTPDVQNLQNVILSRRSIRAFSTQSISKDEFDDIVQIARLAADIGKQEALEVYTVVNNVEGVYRGVYIAGMPQKKGDFRQKAGYLCLEQKLGSDSATTIFITAKPTNYQTAMICAGIFGHGLYIGANALGVGASGIGAYYDEETKALLGTDNQILYAFAIGR